MAKLSKALTALMDHGTAADIFVDGIARLDDGGAVTHITWYLRQNVDGKTYRMSTLRLIVPTDMLPTLSRQLANPANADTDLVGCAPVGDEDIPLLVN